MVIYNAQRSQLKEGYDGTVGASLDFSVDVPAGEACYVQVKPYGTSGGYRLTVQ